MLKFAIERLTWSLISVLVVFTFVFIAGRSSGDPVLSYLPLDYTDAQYEAMRERLGLDQAEPVQYFKYIGHAIRGDFGESHTYREAASSVVGRTLLASLRLGLVAFVFTVVVGTTLGVLAGTRPSAPLDVVIRILAAGGQALPGFMVALGLLWIFGVKYQWLPVSGDGGITHYILPTLALSASPIATLTRLTRSAVIIAARQDYVRTARSKGLHANTVIRRHILRNALIAIVTAIGLVWPTFVGGAVIIETVFSWPGMGRLIMMTARQHDLAVVQLVTLVFAVIFILTNLLIDLSYSIIDPRIRHAR